MVEEDQHHDDHDDDDHHHCAGSLRGSVHCHNNNSPPNNNNNPSVVASDNTNNYPNLWVLVIGINAEWPDDRCRIGDVALCRAFAQYTANVSWVADADATASHVQFQLTNILQQITETTTTTAVQDALPATLVVYFGGHGLPGRLLCAKPSSTGADGLDEEQGGTRANDGKVETKECDEAMTNNASASDSDCCYLNHCDLMATMEQHLRPCDRVWILLDCCYSGSFVESVEQRRFDKATAANYCVIMSTAPDATAGGAWTLTETWLRAMAFRERITIRQMLSGMRAEIQRVKNNHMCHLIMGDDGIQLDDEFPFRIPSARVAANPHNNTVSSASLPLSERQKVHCSLAELGLFRSYQMPPGSLFWGLWGNDTHLYRGRVLDDDEIPWAEWWSENEGLSDGGGTVGPFVPVEWIDADTYSLIPLGHCFFVRNFEDETTIATTELRTRAQQAARQELQRLAVPSPLVRVHDYRVELLLRSLESAGKRLVTAPEATKDELGLLEFCNKASSNNIWSRGTAVALTDSTTCWEVLTMHLNYNETGDYCLVQCVESGRQFCLPTNCIRTTRGDNEVI